jgi:hypothetical protein
MPNPFLGPRYTQDTLLPGRQNLNRTSVYYGSRKRISQLVGFEATTYGLGFPFITPKNTLLPRYKILVSCDCYHALTSFTCMNFLMVYRFMNKIRSYSLFLVDLVYHILLVLTLTEVRLKYILEMI